MPLLRRFPSSSLVLVLAALGCAAENPSSVPDPYAYTPPPGGGAPAALAPAVWNDPGGGQGHLQQDLEPYWAMAEAKGCTRSGQVGSQSQSAVPQRVQKLRSPVLTSHRPPWSSSAR